MTLYYNPLEIACKSRIGAIEQGSELTLNVYIRQGGEENFSAEICTLVLYRDGCDDEFFPMEKMGERFHITLRFNRVGLYFYYFKIGERVFSCGKLRKGIFKKTIYNWQITVYEKGYKTPNWFKGGIMYQIFPDRFCKKGDYPLEAYKVMRKWGEQPYFRANEQGQILNNDFFGGNLNGIREKLDFLYSLGVTVIYLNPIFEAFSNHRYDTGDYMKIDGLLGTMGDFKSLVDEAKSRGIHIILDGVFNHTGTDSRYFNQYNRYPAIGAYQSKESPYADWFRFRSFPNEYECWWGVKSLPAVNEASPSYQNFIFGDEGVLKYWLRCGIDGYRLDVADELPDFFLKKLRRSVKEENPDAIIIGEVWEDASNKISYDVRREYFQGAELDCVMNYPLKDAIINFVCTGNTELLRETLAMLIDNYPEDALHCLMNSLGTHDTPRILTVLGGKQCANKEEMAVTRLSDEERHKAKQLLKIAALLQFTLPGVPCVYYGDENGMEGYADPFCRGCYNWEHTDNELIEYYRTLGKTRSNHGDIFKNGCYCEIFADSSCLIYERNFNKKSAYIFVNRSGRSYQLRFHGKYTENLSRKDFSDRLTVEPFSYGIITQS